MRQLARYTIVGITSNLAGYLAYLLLTWLNVGPKLAMSMVYVTGATVGFLGNRQWTFAHNGKITTTFLKYGVAHGFGYSLNYLILYIFVDGMHLPHQAVQAVAIFVVAGMLFALFKIFVFPPESGGQREALGRVKNDHV